MAGEVILTGPARLPEQSAPATPPSGTAVLYFFTDGRLYWKDDGGVEHALYGANVNFLGTLDADFYLPISNVADRNGVVIKAPNTAWGLSQDYGEGNFISMLNESPNQGPQPPVIIFKIIGTTTNAAPIQVNTTTNHGLTTGDIVNIHGTGIGTVDNRYYQITVVDADSFTLDGTSAPGSTASAGWVMTDRDPHLARFGDVAGLGLTSGIHLATGLRGMGGGRVQPSMSLWVSPSVDATGLVIDNADTTTWGPTPITDFLLVRDIRSSPERSLVRIKADGTIVMRPKSGLAANSKMLAIRNDADSADVWWVENEGDAHGLGLVTAMEGLSTQAYIGDVFGFAGLAMGSAIDTFVVRQVAGVVGLYNFAYLPERTAAQVTTLGTPASGGFYFYARDDGTLRSKNDAGVEINHSQAARWGIIPWVFDNGASALTTGAKKAYVTVPYDCTITGWRIFCDPSGSIQFDIWKDTYANHPPTVADTITASAKPSVTTATKNESTTLTGWTTALTKGQVLEVNIDSVTSVTKARLELFVTPTGV